MHRQVLLLALCAIVTSGAREAAAQGLAQPWTDRGYFNLNAGFEAASGDLNDASTFRIYDEDGSLAVAHSVDSGALFDLSAGARVWRNVSFGLGFHRGSNSSDAAVAGTVPHPLFFNRARPVALAVTGLDRTERAIHLQFGYMLPINDRLDVHLTVGPSFFHVKQDVVGDIAVAEVGFPFSDVNATPTLAERTDSPTGFNVGADVAFRVYSTDTFNLGVGLLIRYTGATANFTVFRNEVSSDLGGAHVGFGGRFRF